jgi:CRP/FNR family transcriptional regulator, cyclic AMP receptor protein
MYSQADFPQLFHRIPWFLDLRPDQIDRLAAIATLHEIEPGEILFQEGEREDLLYILLEGQVVLEFEVPNHGRVPFYTAETLDIIGWSTLTPIVRQRTAGARAARHSLLVGLQGKLLEQLCNEDHDLGYIIMRRVANVAATRLLTTRVQLMEMILHTTPQESAF